MTAKKATTPNKKAAPKTKTEAKTPTRAVLLAELDALKWEGPRSYTATDLRAVLIPWVKAGCPKDGAAPAGAIAYVHPPEAKAKNQTRIIARDLRAAIKDALDGGDADRVVGLAQALREALA